MRIRLLTAVTGLVVALGSWRAPAAELATVARPYRVDDRVVVRAEEGLYARGAQLARAASGSLARIERDLADLARLGHVEVRVVRHAADIAAAAPPGHGAPSWAVGTAYPDAGVVVVALRGPGGELVDAERTLDHELAHLALARALGPNEVPRWLTEGFAYLESTELSWGRVDTLVSAVFRHRVIRLADLDDAFPAREDEVALAYAESYDFVAFLARRGRWPDDRDDGSRAAFQQLLAELAQGTPLGSAAVDAFGRSLAQLEVEWLSSLENRYLWIPVGLGGTALWASAALLLVAGWLRRRHQARRRLAAWELEEAVEESRELASRDLIN